MAINSVNNPLPIFSVILLAMCLMPTDSLALELSELASPASGHSAQVHLSKDMDGKGTDGTLVMSWLEHNDGVASLRYSVFQGAAWQPAQTVVSGSDWFVNWADFPSVSPIDGDLWAAHWLHKRPGGTYAYDVAMAVSSDAGKTWSKQITPHNDGTPTEHGFVSLFPWNGGVGALWLDGRNMLGEDHDNPSDRPVSEIGMTLRSAVIKADGAITQPQIVDALVCDCCQTDIALLPDGPVAVYRNRTEQEIRDIQVARAVDGQWQTPVTVGDDQWNIAGCPVNGPAIAAREQQVAVAWFSGADNQPTVQMAYSQDGGVSFGKAVAVDTAKPQGRVDVELLEDGSAVVLWMCNPEQGASLCLRRVSKEGEQGVVQRLDGVVKPGGFPHFSRIGDNLLFAWVESANDVSQIKTARLSLDNL